MRELNFGEVEQVAGGNVLTDVYARFKAGISRQDIEFGLLSGSVGLAMAGALKGMIAPICGAAIVVGMVGYDYFYPASSE